MSYTRQLAAIMFTDIQGYTALMQKNEEKAIQSREKHRDIFNSATEKFNGRILQYYGDGTLSILIALGFHPGAPNKHGLPPLKANQCKATNVQFEASHSEEWSFLHLINNNFNAVVLSYDES